MTTVRPKSWRPYTAGLVAPDVTGAILAPDTQLRAGPPPLLRDLSDPEIDAVVSAGTKKILDRGTMVFKQGAKHDGIFLIESGRIKVFYTSPAGQELTLAYWHPGNFVGGPDVFDTGHHVWSGIAVQNSSVLHLSGDVVRHLVLSIPPLSVNIIEGLAFKGRCYSGMAQMLGTRSATERLAHVLLHLVSLYGVEEERGTLIAAAFTHADLASMIGATRQWVTISLSKFAKAGIVGTHHSNLVVVQPNALAEIKNGLVKKRL